MARIAQSSVSPLWVLALLCACGGEAGPTDNGGTTQVATQLAVRTEPSGA